MIRGTTAPFKFKLPYEFSDDIFVTITFWQENYNGPKPTRPLPIVKVAEQCEPTEDPHWIVVSLTPEETARFKADRKAFVQFQGKKKSTGVGFASFVEEIMVYSAYNESIWEEDIIPTPTTEDIVVLDGSTIL